MGETVISPRLPSTADTVLVFLYLYLFYPVLSTTGCCCARYPVDYGLPGRVQVNPLSTLEEEEDDYTLHPTVQALDVLHHRGNTTIF